MRATSLFGLAALMPAALFGQSQQKRPNIVIIEADDLGFGDLSCYGATALKTPGMDRLAEEGLRFTDAFCTAATSTPSRYSLLTKISVEQQRRQNPAGKCRAHHQHATNHTAQGSETGRICHRSRWQMASGTGRRQCGLERPDLSGSP